MRAPGRRLSLPNDTCGRAVSIRSALAGDGGRGGTPNPMAGFEVSMSDVGRVHSPSAPGDAVGSGERPRARKGKSSTGIPAQLTSLIGREQDIVEVATLLALHRLVTITGVGGIGKTRLA